MTQRQTTLSQNLMISYNLYQLAHQEVKSNVCTCVNTWRLTVPHISVEETNKIIFQ